MKVERCEVCGHSLADSPQGLAQRWGSLTPTLQQVAAMGLVEALQASDPAAALACASGVLADLPPEAELRSRIEGIAARLGQSADRVTRQHALIELREDAVRGDLAAAYGAARNLPVTHPDPVRDAWLAVLAAAVDPDHLLALTRTALAGTGVGWADIPSTLRAGLVEALIALGEIELAERVVAVAFTDGDPGGGGLRGQLHSVQSDRRGAALLEAETAYRAGQPARARELTEKLLADVPGHIGARLLAGEACLAMGAGYAAGAHFRAALENPTTNSDERGIAALGLARTYEALGDLHEAQRLLAQCAEQDGAEAIANRVRRRLDGRPAVHIITAENVVTADTLCRVPASPPDYHAIFAVAVRGMARQTPDSGITLDQLVLDPAGFIAALGGLAGTHGNPVVELRLIRQNDAGTLGTGEIQAAYLVRTSDSDPAGARRVALGLWRHISAHLPLADRGLVQYEPVYDERELAALLAPFEPHDAAEIMRPVEGREGDMLPLPFSSAGTNLHELVRALRRATGPALLRVRLEPTNLNMWERRALTSDAGLDDQPDDDEPGGALKLIRQHSDQSRRLAALRARHDQLARSAFLLNIRVATEEPDALLPFALAAALCGPGGGYEVVRAETVDQVAAAHEDLILLDAARPARDDEAEVDDLCRLRWLADPAESALMMRLPIPGPEGVPGLPLIGVKPLEPTGLAEEGVMLGETVSAWMGQPQPVRLRLDDRRRHMYVVGKTGTGKSTELKEMILQDIAEGRGVAVFDPHGDLAEDVLTALPVHRREDVIVFDPSDEERPIGLNFLQAETDAQRHRITTEFLDMLMRMYDPGQTGIVGPRFQHNVRNAMLTVMLAEPDATLIEVVRALTDENYVRKLLPKVDDPVVRNYWEKQIAKTSDFHKSEILDYIVSKFNKFVGDRLVRNIIGQTRSTLDFRQIMDERKVLIVSLSKGKIGPESASFLGFLLMQSLMVAALSRADKTAGERGDFMVYVDEFQNFATESFAGMLAEGRKYGLCLVMANQYLHQLPDNLIRAVFGNVGTLIAFQVGIEDGRLLSDPFYPAFSAEDLINLPRFTAAARLLVEGETRRPFAMRTRLRPSLPDPALAAEVRALSRQRYGRDVTEIEREVATRFEYMK